jgi:hypothetical protein
MQNLKNYESQVSVLTKIYIWSVLFEPLLYFVIVPQNISGVTGNISRLFQLIVLILLSFKVLLSLKIKYFNPLSSASLFYTYYFIFIILSGIIGYLTGTYTLTFLHDSEPVVKKINFFVNFITGASYRPFIEYFIALYYFIYFVILAQYILVKKVDIDYFFRWFNALFLFCILFGFFDLFLIHVLNPAPEWMKSLNLNYHGIGRHIADSQYPGERFHGIAGEPRDAFVYLLLCIGILSLRDIWQNQKKLTSYWIILIATAMILTESFSAMLGIIFSIILLMMFYLKDLKLKKQLFFIFMFLIAILGVSAYINSSYRLTGYYYGFLTVYDSLSRGEVVTSALNVAMNNIYPVWHLWLEVKELNFFHLFFGNGLGSSSVINNNYWHYNATHVINPNSSIIRMIYDSGMIGILLFILAFIMPLKRLNIEYKIYRKFKFLMLLILGTYFAHRSIAPYLFLGITLVVLRFQSSEKKSDYKCIKS